MCSRVSSPVLRGRQRQVAQRGVSGQSADDTGGDHVRRGAASLDYVLVIGVVFLLGGLSLVLSSKIMVLAYDMICALVSWPFL